jgi:uncharacterized membrane protein YfhO
VEGLILMGRFGSTWIYENEFALPRAWVQDPSDPVGTKIQEAGELNFSPNQVELSASGPGLLVLAEIYYPGWQVWVNGEKGQIFPVMGLLRGVLLTEPSNHVKFVFKPVWLYLGLGLAAVAIFLVLRSLRKVRVAA